MVGGPSAYNGRSLSGAHSGRHIPREAFDVVLDHMVDALDEAGIDGAVIERVVDSLTSLESEVVGGT